MAESASVVAARWKAAMVASIPKMREKVKSLTVNPMLEAAKKKDAYVAGVNEAAASGKWEAGLRAASFDEWKVKTGDVGSARIQSGVEAATPKMTSFLDQFLPFAEAAKQAAKQMPSATLEDRLQIMMANARRMAEFKYRKAGR